MSLQQPTDRGFRDELRPLVGERDRQFSGTELWTILCEIKHLATNLLRDSVPDPAAVQPGGLLGQLRQSADTRRTSGKTSAEIIPSFSSVPRADRCDCSTGANDLKLFRCRISHVGSPPSPSVLF